MKKPPVSTMLIRPHLFVVAYDEQFASVTSTTGACMEDDQRILLEPNLGRSVELETLTHEGLHAVWHQTELDRVYTDEQEEQVVWTLAPRIMSFIQDNPKLIGAIQACRRR